MRAQPSILHLDLDAFFASVEQRDKPSLRGKPVIVGGTGQRGVVSTASYEARVFGVRSAMPSHEARRRCPNAAFLGGRFEAYRVASAQVMALLHELSPLVEPLSLDEAFVDLEASPEALSFTADALTQRVRQLKRDVAAATGGLTASVGVASSKFMAKVASELAKPDGVVVVAPGTEVELIAPLSVRAIPGVGPVTADKLHTFGLDTIADLHRLGEAELIRLLGAAGGRGLYHLSQARDDRPVEASREAKSVSVEDTFEHDVTDRATLNRLLGRYAESVAERIERAGLFAKTITVKVRMADFTTITRSRTLSGATGDAEVIAGTARSLLDAVDISAGVRLLGAGVAGFAQAAQEALFSDLVGTSDQTSAAAADEVSTDLPSGRFGGGERVRWVPGADVEHDEHGPGWVWGSGLGRVTVRFETAATGPGPVKTFAATDPALRPRGTPVETQS